MLCLGAFLLTAVLVLTTPLGLAYHGQFTVDAFSAFMKLLILAGAAMAIIMALDYNRARGASTGSSSRCSCCSRRSA